MLSVNLCYVTGLACQTSPVEVQSHYSGKLPPGIDLVYRIGTPHTANTAGNFITYLFIGTADDDAAFLRFTAACSYHVVVGKLFPGFPGKWFITQPSVGCKIDPRTVAVFLKRLETLFPDVFQYFLLGLETESV